MASIVIERVASAEAAPKGNGEELEHVPRGEESALENAGRPQIASDEAQRKGKVAVHLTARKRVRNPMC